MKKIFTLLWMFVSLSAKSQSLEFYVSDAGGFNNPPWQILKFDHNGQNPSVFINSNINWPQDILFMEDSNAVLISNLGSNTITKHNATTGAYISDFATNLTGPTRMKIGPDSTLYVLQWNGDGKVKRYQLDGTYLGEFTSVGVPRSIGIDWDTAGNLYVSSYNTKIVRKFTTSGTDAGIFINSNLLGPTNIWFETNGDLLVSDYNGTAVKRFNSSGVYINDFMQGLSHSEGVALFPNGNIMIGNGATQSVKLFDNNGSYIHDLIPTGSGNLLNPNAIVIREVAAVGVNEQIYRNTLTVYPTAGQVFTIKSEKPENIASVKIYTIFGQLVDQIQPLHKLIWDSGIHAEGMYIIVTEMKDNTTFIEKVIVKRLAE